VDNKDKRAVIFVHVTALADTDALSTRLESLLSAIASRRQAVDAGTEVVDIDPALPSDPPTLHPERWIKTIDKQPGTWDLDDFVQGHWQWNDPGDNGYSYINSELQFYTDDTNNITVDPELGLIIHAKNEDVIETLVFDGVNRVRRLQYADVDKTTIYSSDPDYEPLIDIGDSVVTRVLEDKANYGTVSITNSSAVITGTSTQFTGGLHFTNALFEEQIQVIGGSNPTFDLYYQKAFTVTDLTNDVCTCVGHGFPTGLPILITSSSGSIPGGTSAIVTYYVRSLTDDTFSLFSSLANANNTGSQTGRINLTTVGSGTLYAQPQTVTNTSITAKQTASENLSGCPYVRKRTYRYTSGMVHSYQKFYQRYGYFRWVVKVPPWKGMWPAVWMMRGGSGTSPQNYGTFPEWDLLEMFGNNPTNRGQLDVTLHFDAGSSVRKQGTRIITSEDYTRRDIELSGNWAPSYRRAYVNRSLALDAKTSDYKTGTVTVTNGSAAVTGSGTSFTTEYAVGDPIEVTGVSRVERILSINSDTSMTTLAAFSGAASGATHRIAYDLMENGTDRVQHFLLNLAITPNFTPDGSNVWPAYYIVKSLEAWRHKAFNDYSGTLLWLDAQIGFTQATGISQWSDQSGNACHFTQATGSKQPTLVNYRKGPTEVSFTGSSSQVLNGNSAAKALFQNKTAVTVYLVHTVSLASSPIMAWTTGTGVGNRFGIGSGANDNVTMTLRRADGDGAAVVNTPNSSYPAGTYITVVQIDYTNGTVTVRKNGTAIVSAQAWGVGSGPSANTASLNAYIGAASDLSNYRTGTVRDIVVRDGLDDADTLAILEGYLGWKYDITVS
jgi:hypothetical protein